jgi:hypothetical protein
MIRKFLKFSGGNAISDSLKMPKIVDIGVDFTVEELIIIDAMIDEDAAIKGLVEGPNEADFDAF